jgi:hypothetical protein
MKAIRLGEPMLDGPGKGPEGPSGVELLGLEEPLVAHAPQTGHDERGLIGGRDALPDGPIAQVDSDE